MFNVQAAAEEDLLCPEIDCLLFKNEEPTIDYENVLLDNIEVRSI